MYIRTATRSRVVVKFFSLLGILIFIALIVERHPLRFDLTRSKEHSLTERSIEVIKKLKERINIIAFYQTGQEEATGAKDLLESYRYNSRNISYTFVDPDKNPGLARKYEIDTMETLIIKGKDRWYTVRRPDEEKITNTILRILRGDVKKIYFLSGHGEKDINNTERKGYSLLKDALKKENYIAERLTLLKGGRIPEDTSLLVIGGPEKPLFKAEVDAIKRYLKKEGAAIILIDPHRENGLDELLKDYSLLPVNMLIYDELSRAFTGDPLSPLTTRYGNHAITRGFDLVSIFPMSMPIKVTKDSKGKIAVHTLVSSSPVSWAIGDLNRLFTSKKVAFKEGEDIKGPFSIGVIAEIPAKDEKGSGARIVVFGDSDFVSNGYLNLSGNSNLFLNTVSYLVEGGKLITIKPRKKKASPIVLTKRQGRILFLISLVLTPGVVLLSGIFIYVVRRRHR